MVIVGIRSVFSWHKELNNCSHCTDEIGNVHKICNNVCTFGKNSLSHSSKAWINIALLGRSWSTQSLLRPQQKNSTSKTWGDGRSSHLHSTAKQFAQGILLKNLVRLEVHTGLGSKYVSISEIWWSTRWIVSTPLLKSFYVPASKLLLSNVADQQRTA